MTGQSLTYAVALVLLMGLLVFGVEQMIPVTRQQQFQAECRATLLRMEARGGLDQNAVDDLRARLSARGFTGVTVSGTPAARQGSLMQLEVTGESIWNHMRVIGAVRERETLRHRFARQVTSRRVVN